MSNARGRNVSFICYDVPPMSLLSSAYQWAYILHDRDILTDNEGNPQCDEHGEVILKKPHYHVVLNFKNARYFSSIAKECNIAANLVCHVHNQSAALAYLTHRTSAAMDAGKYQYNPSDVVKCDDLDFDFSQVFVSGQTVNWIEIFDSPTLKEAMKKYSCEGMHIDSLQSFKNFVSTYEIVTRLSSRSML